MRFLTLVDESSGNLAQSDPMAAKQKSGWGGLREGAGRKPVIADRADRTIRFERGDLESLDALAADRGQSAADLIREAVRAYLAKQARKKR